MNGSASRRRTRLAVVAVLLATALTTGSLSGLAGPGNGDQPPRHEQIRIRSDEELLLPDEVSGNGVRRGSGTAEDPFVIANWTIPFGQDIGILVTSTTLNLVIRDVRFVHDGSGVWDWPPVELLNATSVTVADNRFPGSPSSADPSAAVIGFESDDLTVRNVTIEGNTSLNVGAASNVLLRDIDLRGDRAQIETGSGSYRMEDIRIEGRWWAGSLTDAIAIGPEMQEEYEHEKRPRCHATIRNLTVPSYMTTAVSVWKGCGVDLQGVRANEVAVGVKLMENASAEIEDARFDGTWYPDDDFKDYDRTEGGDAAGVNFKAGVLLEPGAHLEASDLEVRDFWTGIRAEDASLTVRDAEIVANRAGVLIEGPCTDCSIQESNIIGNAERAVTNLGASTLDARHNWWGSPDGPPDEMIEGDVLVEPWRTEGPAPPETGLTIPFPALVAAAALGLAAWARRD